VKSREFVTENRSRPCIVVDVQPEYSGINDGDENPVFAEIIDFVAVKQTGPVLMFVNAEETGLTGDTIQDVKMYWENTVRGEQYDYDDTEYDDLDSSDVIDWSRFTIVDKGYGAFRSWMDQRVSESIIIKVIRALYQAKANDSRDLDPNRLKQLVGEEWQDWMAYDPLIINWTSVAQLKSFQGAHIMGGGRNECLREVELLMNAFNISYKRIDHLVYG
jgi:hypothetical protein